MKLDMPDSKPADLVQTYLERFIYEHPDTVFQAFMRYYNDWRKWLWENAPRDLLQFYRDNTPKIDRIKEREIDRRTLSPIGQGIYHRLEWPQAKPLPLHNWPIAKRIADEVLTQLIRLPYPEALNFYAELIVAWFFTCPEILLHLDTGYPIKFPEPATDIDYVNGLWDFYYEYITDYRHAKYTHEDFIRQIEKVGKRKKF